MVDTLKPKFYDLVAMALGAFLIYHNGSKTPVVVQPAPVVVPDRKPILPRREAEKFVEGGPIGPEGQEVVTDLPKEYRKQNIASKGLGCCVFRSADHAAHWQNIPALYGFPEWMVEKGIEGGGYPEKVDTLIPQIAKDRGATVDYVQHTGGDPAFLEAALATGRMVCVTYDGRDPRYKKQIGHMVNLIYLDANTACILDNNFVDKEYWMSREEFLSRWKGHGGGWAFAFLAPPPMPAPYN